MRSFAGNPVRAENTPIWPHFRKILTQSILYGTGNVATGLLQLVVIVILTRHLSREGYGAYENAFVWFVLLAEILTLGLSSSVFRYYNLFQDQELRRIAVSTAFVFVMIVCLAANVIIYLMSDRIAGLLYGDPAYGHYLVYASAAAGLIVPSRLAQVYIRIRERPLFYTIAVLVRVGAILAGIYLLVEWRDMGASGSDLSLLFANLLFALILVPWLASQVGFTFSIRTLRGMLSFGLPYIPAGISMWTLSLSDRYFLTHYASLEAVGLYSVAYRLGMAMALVLAGFQLAWPQFAYSLEHADEGNAVYSRTLTYLFLTMMTIGLFLSLFREEVISLVATPDYLQAAYIIPFVAFAYAFEGIFTVTSLGAVFQHKTSYVAFSTLAAAAMNVVLNVVFIPRYGIAGAAGSTTVSYMVLALLMARFSRKFRDIPFEWSRISVVASVALVLVLASFALHRIMGGGMEVPTVLVDVALFLCFFPMLLLLRFFRREEMRRVRDVFVKKFSGLTGGEGA